MSWRLFAPLVSGFTMGRVFSMDQEWLETKEQSQLTPPDYVFPVAWTLLYLSVGYALWQTTSKPARTWLAASIVTADLWTISIHYKNLCAARLAVLGALLFSLAYYNTEPSAGLRRAITPYIVWLSFALYLASNLQ